MTRPWITLAVLLAACNNGKGATLNDTGVNMPVDADRVIGRQSSLVCES